MSKWHDANKSRAAVRGGAVSTATQNIHTNARGGEGGGGAPLPCMAVVV